MCKDISFIIYTTIFHKKNKMVNSYLRVTLQVFSKCHILKLNTRQNNHITQPTDMPKIIFIHHILQLFDNNTIYNSRFLIPQSSEVYRKCQIQLTQVFLAKED